MNTIATLVLHTYINIGTSGVCKMAVRLVRAAPLYQAYDNLASISKQFLNISSYLYIVSTLT